MKKLAVLILLLTPLVIFAEQKKLTFEQVYQKKGEKLHKPLPRILNWINDVSYYELKNKTLFKVNARSGKSFKIVKQEDFIKLREQGFNLGDLRNASTDLSKYITIKNGDIYLLLRDKKEVIRVSKTKGIEQNTILSPH